MRRKIIKFKKKFKVNSSIYYITVGYKCKKKSKNFFFENLGVLNFKHSRLMVINYMRLGYWLNRGAILNKNVKKYLTKFIYVRKNNLFL